MYALIKFAKTNDNGIIPHKRNEDACYDLWSAEGDITLAPHEIRLVDTGIATAFSDKWVAVIKERSSVGSKGVATRAGVIDSGYRNSWKVCLENTTDHEITLPSTKAIAQFLILPVPEFTEEEVDYEELKQISSERGLGGFGSTDTK